MATLDETLKALGVDAYPVKTGAGRPSKDLKRFANELSEFNEQFVNTGKMSERGRVKNEFTKMLEKDAYRGSPDRSFGVMRGKNLDSVPRVQPRSGGVSPDWNIPRQAPEEIFNPAKNTIDKVLNRNVSPLVTGKATRSAIPNSQMNIGKTTLDRVLGREISPLVTGKATKSATKVAKEVANVADEVPKAGLFKRIGKLAKKNPKMALALGAAAAIGGAQLMGGDEQTTTAPTTPPAPPMVEKGPSIIDELMAQNTQIGGSLLEDARASRRMADTRGANTRGALQQFIDNRRY